MEIAIEVKLNASMSPNCNANTAGASSRMGITLVFIFYYCGSQFKRDLYIIELLLFFHFM
ncbi:hypothetical protein FXE69_13885 [Vibrio cholerae]|nr:hypothetical protein B7953_17440 [Vibrio paracholerae]TXX85892.1 hypothetical protein FXF10_17780 [Vibrio cholerae]RBM63333.1 hypothetical protein DLR71_08770 [Vibrio paracholerae]RBM90336.1 hypothetical protein DLR74_06520 [Vibrio paracholerae]TXY13761.1 hypothetical protein FXE97_09180 [Vibrio cholerae]